MMQARMSASDQRLYSPNRDLGHCFDAVIQEVAARCEAGQWDTVVVLAKEKKVSDEELGRACQALCHFVVTQLDDRHESMSHCLARCGFLDLNPHARVIVMAHMGAVILGMHWAGVREATLGGVGPVLTYGRLRWFGRRFSLLMTMPRWRRRLYQLRSRLHKAWRVFTEKHKYE